MGAVREEREERYDSLGKGGASPRLLPSHLEGWAPCHSEQHRRAQLGNGTGPAYMHLSMAPEGGLHGYRNFCG